MPKTSFLAELRATCLAYGLIPIDRDPIETLLAGPLYRSLRYQPDPPEPITHGGAKNKNRDKVKAARKQNRRQK